MHDPSPATTFLFTDIEGSTRLWENEPERMRAALAQHDAATRATVEAHRGVVVKMTGDGVHAVFDDPADAITAALHLQLALADETATHGMGLRIRCGIHLGVVQRRDNDFFGSPVNRTARIMSVAHGGQTLVSQAVAEAARDRLPEGAALLDLGAVRLRDLSSSERVYQLAHPRLRREFPALRSLEAVPNNLPQQVSTFVGRDREIEEVKAALAKARLVTLTGTGGLGKTRLSLQVAADILNDYPDGLWFVELAAITHGELVPQALASVLGVKGEADRPVQEALARHVRDRRLLLVLDNCEHLVAACASLAHELLLAGGGVRILASSREHLNIAGETVYTVSPLSVPSLADTADVDAVMQHEAARLFVERATALQPGFRLNASNAPAVAEICRHLDGIPLALELAAARVRTLSVEQIAARVNDRFRLLTTGERTALPRQQTLRALIDWSYDLLGEKERTLFRRLAVFAGGWSLEAAESVAAGGDVGAADVLDVLSELVEKSLVTRDAERDRYGFLETVRQYAEERLAESGEGDAVRTRHFDHYLAFAERAGAALAGPEQPAFLRSIDADRDNVLAAHAFCVHSLKAAERGYRLVHAIKLYWFMRGLLGLGHRVTVEALAVPDPAGISLARCKALWVAGQIGACMGRYAEAQQYLQESLAMATALDDRRTMAAVLNNLALAALGQGDPKTARRHCEEALALARQSGNKRQIAAASNALAHVHRIDGDLDAAEPLYENCVALARELGDEEITAVGLLNLAIVAMARGRAERARVLLLDVFKGAMATGSRVTVQSALEAAAGLAAVRGEWERAALLYGTADAQTAFTGMQRDPADQAFLQPLIDRTRQALGERFSVALASGRALTAEDAAQSARLWLREAAPA